MIVHVSLYFVTEFLTVMFIVLFLGRLYFFIFKGNQLVSSDYTDDSISWFIKAATHFPRQESTSVILVNQTSISH